MSKFYTIPVYSSGALGGLMLGAVRGEGDSYDRGWTGLLTGLGTTAGIGGSHYLTKQLENWDDILRSRSNEADDLFNQLNDNAELARKQNQSLQKALERKSILDAILNDNDQFNAYAFGKDDTAVRKTVNDIYQAVGGDVSKYDQAMADLALNAENKLKNNLTNVQGTIDWISDEIKHTRELGNELTNKLTSVKKYLNKPMNRLAKKVPLITGLKWLSALALPAAGFAGAKSLGDYFSSRA